MAFQVRLGTTSSIAKNGNGVEGTTMITVPVSSTYKTTSTTLVDSARNSQGVIISNVIKSGIRKIELSWRVISSLDYAKLGTFFNNNFMFYAYYFDQDSNDFECRHCYVGDRVANALENKQWVEVDVGGEIVLEPQYVQGLKLSLIDTGEGTF